MSIPELAYHISDLVPELRLCHRICDAVKNIIEIIVDAVFCRVPVKTWMIRFKRSSENGEVLYELFRGIFFIDIMLHRCRTAGKKEHTGQACQQLTKQAFGSATFFQISES